MKQLEVEIMGQRYLLSCPEGGEVAMMNAVERVNSAMCKIREAGKVKARDRIAVLASLNLSVELSEAIAARQAAVEAFAEQSMAMAARPAEPSPDAELSQLLQRLDAALAEEDSPSN